MHGHTLARMKQCIPFVLAILAIAAACDANNSTGPQTGTVKGYVKDTANDPLVGVLITVIPPLGDTVFLHTGSDGSWQVKNVSVGTGLVEFDSLPADCPTIPAQNFYLTSPGTTATVGLNVACTHRH